MPRLKARVSGINIVEPSCGASQGARKQKDGSKLELALETGSLIWKSGVTIVLHRYIKYMPLKGWDLNLPK